MQFCHWYQLADAAAHAPSGEGVLQLRLRPEDGLIDYPTGKSAMVHYEHASDVRGRALELAAELRGRGLLCRHLESAPDTDLAQFHAKVRGEFVRRFGAQPHLP